MLRTAAHLDGRAPGFIDEAVFKNQSVFADTILTLSRLCANHYATRRLPPGIAIAASGRQGIARKPDRDHPTRLSVISAYRSMNRSATPGHAVQTGRAGESTTRGQGLRPKVRFQSAWHPGRGQATWSCSLEEATLASRCPPLISPGPAGTA
jgi:hypothetical protein